MPVGAAVQRIVPQRLLGRLIYRLARSRRRWIKRPLINWFSRKYAIDLAEAETSNPDDYPTFNAFFTRALTAEARPVTNDPLRVAAPADGTLTMNGRLEEGCLLQAKGRDYSLEELLGEEKAAIEAFLVGHYATIYLAPHNYHRIHAPLTGRLVKTRYIPGRRYCVDPTTAAAISRLFSRNERVVCWFESAFGPYVVVMVGALNVASISTATLGEIGSGLPKLWLEEEPRDFSTGAEIGRFNLGSTVVVLFSNGAIEWDGGLRPGDELLMGMPIGRAVARAKLD